MNDNQLTTISLLWKGCQYAGPILFLAGIVSGFGGYYFEGYFIVHWMVSKTFWMYFSIYLGLSGMLVGILMQRLYLETARDPLTNLGNRRYFYRRLVYELAKIRKSKGHIVLAFIDVDNFKRINDTMGHVVGDQVLVRLSAIFRQHAGPNAGISRWGGDEFIFIFPRETLEKVKTVFERINQQIKTDRLLYGATISSSLITATQDMEIDHLMIKADQLLHKAKTVKNSMKAIEPQC